MVKFIKQLFQHKIPGIMERKAEWQQSGGGRGTVADGKRTSLRDGWGGPGSASHRPHAAMSHWAII